MSDKLFARFREGERVAISTGGEPEIAEVLRTYWKDGAPLVVVKNQAGIAHLAENKVQHLDQSVAFLNGKINELITELDGNDLWDNPDFPTNDIKNIESALDSFMIHMEHLKQTFDELRYVVALREEVVTAARSV